MTARLPLVDPDDPDADPKARELLGLVRAGLAASESLPWTEGLLTFGGRAYQGSSLSPEHRELAYLGASVANDCHY
jgi:alkylhydroperoxidase family enzyme